jgi:hypothetical protein
VEDELIPAIRECCSELAECFGEHVAPIKFTGDLAKIVTSIPARILFRKIIAFLDGVPKEKREVFIKKMGNDHSYREKVGEYLVAYLDKMDEPDKAQILAKVFCAFIDDKIQFETLRRLAASINAAFIEDLKHISGSMPSILQEYLGNLLSAGLSRPGAFPLINNDPSFELNHLGKIFQQVMRDEPITA